MAEATPRQTCSVAEGRGGVRLGLAADYLQLSKPRLTAMVLWTVAVGYFLCCPAPTDWLLLGHTLVGTGLVAVGAGALNQLLEKDVDGRMRRTRQRPLPAGRLSAAAVLRFGVACSCVGLAYLAWWVNPLASALAGLTLALYLFAYTPLKAVTPLNTVVGAVPGALPPLIGSAATGSLDSPAWLLFLILFLWQFPHFWAIAWLYREDYARAGLQMLSTCDGEDGKLTGRFLAHGCLLLVLASLTPYLAGLAGPRYLLAALVLGSVFVGTSAAFLWRASLQRARRVMWASLVYLPLLCLAWLGDGPGTPFAG
jgi:protoheme IX farnesyltransferase